MGDWRMMGSSQRRRQGAPSYHMAGAQNPIPYKSPEKKWGEEPNPDEPQFTAGTSPPGPGSFKNPPPYPSGGMGPGGEAKWAINAQASGRGDQVPTEAIMARKSGQQLYDDIRATGPTGRAAVTDTGLINGIPAPSPRLRTESNIVRANARRMMNY